MKYPEKLDMRRITRSIGYGFTRPVKQSRQIAQEESLCRSYNCSLSQRVELSFTLKDDPTALDKILRFNSGGL